ncbi:DUF866-domain-containing protein [Ramicandelaber brevisporus]|nr:DUF866-domain-containing protein [Ramicandelaber brevisporus]
MVLISVQVKATLEGVTDLQPVDAHDFDWTFRVKCTNCGDEAPKPVTINKTEEVELEGSRGTANISIKCKGCRRGGSATIFIRPYGAEDSEKWKTIVTFDVRGNLDLVEHLVTGEWMAKGEESNTVFDDVEFESEKGGDWVGYDDKAGSEVSIMDFETKLQAEKASK